MPQPSSASGSFCNQCDVLARCGVSSLLPLFPRGSAMQGWYLGTATGQHCASLCYCCATGCESSQDRKPMLL